MESVVNLWVIPSDLFVVFCKSTVHWQVGSLQRQVAFFLLGLNMLKVGVNVKLHFYRFVLQNTSRLVPNMTMELIEK